MDDISVHNIPTFNLADINTMLAEVWQELNEQGKGLVWRKFIRKSSEIRENRVERVYHTYVLCFDRYDVEGNMFYVEVLHELKSGKWKSNSRVGNFNVNEFSYIVGVAIGEKFNSLRRSLPTLFLVK